LFQALGAQVERWAVFGGADDHSFSSCEYHGYFLRRIAAAEIWAKLRYLKSNKTEDGYGRRPKFNIGCA
jgi:hypothetical protein